MAQIRGVRGVYTAAMVLAAAEVAAALGFPMAMRAFYDRVLIGGETAALGPVLAAMGGLAVAMIVTKAASQYLFTLASERVVLKVRAQLVEHLCRRSLARTPRLATGELVSLATNDVASMATLYRTVLGTASIGLLRLGATLGVLAYIDPRLLLVAVPLLGLFASVPLGVTPRLRQAGEGVQQRAAGMTATLHETFSALRDIKAFGRTGWAVARQDQAGRGLTGAKLGQTRLELTALGSFVVYWLTVVGISWYGALAVAGDRLTVGTLLALLLYFGQLQEPVDSLVNANNRLQAGLAAARRVFAHVESSAPSTAPALRDRPPARSRSASGPRPAAPAAATLAVEDLHFRYRPDVPCLEGVNLRAAAGELVGVVGDTGAGKTTLVEAILGLVTPARGHVLVNGHNLAELASDDVRRLIALSSADAVLFDLTVAENIRFGRLDATDDEVRAAAYLSGLDRVIDALPEGYDTRIGERGGGLSTGQRQRVALARALVCTPALLLLDEATSGLDGPTEKAVFDRVLGQPNRPTLLVVTHRLSALTRADRIHVLAAGSIVEEGDHSTLLSARGRYCELWQRQGLGQPDGVASTAVGAA